MSDRQNILFKSTIVFIIFAFVSVAIIVKIAYLQFFYDKESAATDIKQVVDAGIIEPARGDIYSSDGKLLATSVAYFEAGVDLNCPGMTQKVFDENVDSLSICLAEMFPKKTKDQYKKELIKARDKGSRYYRFNYKIKYSDFKKMQAFPILRRGRVKGGFVYVKTYEREKPFKQLANRTIGTVPKDGRFGVGLEGAYDSILRGVEGYTIKERIPGNMWMPVENADYIQPKDGYNIISTIDIGLQDIVESALEKKLKYHQAEYGTAVLMEVKTGKVRAIANLKRHVNGYYFEETNYAVGHAADPGSTFKIASAIVAIEDGFVMPDDIIETGNGKIKYYNKVMRDTKQDGYGSIPFKKVLEVSSNVGISKIIHENYRHQPMKFLEGIKELGLDKPLGVVIKGEPMPVVNKPGDKEWSGLSLTQMSIGYELQITPLQMLALYNAIANNACLLKPSFVEAISYHGKIIEEYKPEVIKSKICSEKTLQSVKEMLEGVVANEGGTAHRYRSSEYKFAGKTGTAQMQYGISGEKLEYHASFIGYFPAEDPMFSCAVSIYKPKINGYYGGPVATPVFKEIADNIFSSNKYFSNNKYQEDRLIIPSAKKGNKRETAKVYNYLNLDNNAEDISGSEWIVSSIDNDKIKFSPVNFSDKSRIPNVLNMGLKDAVFILENYGLMVDVKGRGKVRQMQPNHGEVFKKGDHVTLTLEM